MYRKFSGFPVLQYIKVFLTFYLHCPMLWDPFTGALSLIHEDSQQFTSGKAFTFPTQAEIVVNIAVLWHYTYKLQACAASKDCKHPCHFASRMSSEKKFIAGTGSAAQDIQDSLAHFPGYYSLYDMGSLRTLSTFSGSPRNTMTMWYLQPRNNVVFIPL